MLIYIGSILFHVWMIAGFIMFIGYLTCSDYYDSFSNKFIDAFKKTSWIALIMFAFVGFIGITSLDGKTDLTPSSVYVISSFMGFLIVLIGAIATFMICMKDIRRWFGHKRGKY